MMSKPVKPFFLSGEAGDAVGSAAIRLDSLGVETALLRLRASGAGSWSFYLPADTPILPAVGQRLHLLDGAGRRWFSGRVRRDFEWDAGRRNRWSITVEDAWKQLAETGVEEARTDAAGVSATRPLATFPTGDLAASIRRLLEMAIAAGVEIQVGEIDAAFPVPQMTFSKSTYAEALADMLKFIPDGAAELDHSMGDFPTLHVRRIGQSAPVTTLELGAETDDTQEIRLREQSDLKPLSITIRAVARDAEQKLIWADQVAGDPDAEKRRQQTVVVSGSENNDVLPTEVYESAVIQSFSSIAAWLAVADSQIRTHVATFGSNPVQTTVKSTTNTVHYPAGDVASSPNYTTVATSYPAGFVGVAIGTDGLQSPPPWLVTQLGLVEGYLAGEFWIQDDQPTASFPKRRSINEICYDVWWFDVDYFTVRRLTKRPIKCWLIPSAIAADYASPTTVWRGADFEFAQPPPSLAADLLHAQRLTPWTGSATLGPAAPTLPLPGGAVCALGADPAWEHAMAAVESTEVDLRTLRSRILFGQPPATSPASLLDRFRSAARDNIAS